MNLWLGLFIGVIITVLKWGFWCLGLFSHLYSIPAIVAQSKILELVNSLTDPANFQKLSAPLNILIDELAARIACHASVRAGDDILPAEAYALFDKLDSAECGLSCPHGRPVFWRGTKAEVEGWFGRREAM